MNISNYLVGIIGALLVSSFSFADHLQIEITTDRTIAHHLQIEITADRTTAAHYLDEAAAHLHEVLHDYSNYSHLIKDAHKFNKRTYKFHESIERGSSYNYAYRRIRSSFNHLSSAFNRAHDKHHNEHLIKYWVQLVAYYEQLRIAM